MTREGFDKKYFKAKTQKDKNEAYLEYVFCLEAQLKDKDDEIERLKELVNSFNKSMVGGNFNFEAWKTKNNA